MVLFSPIFISCWTISVQSEFRATTSLLHSTPSSCPAPWAEANCDILSTQCALLGSFCSLFPQKWRTNLSEGAWGSLPWLCVHLSASRTFALVWVTNSYTQKSWLQKQFKTFGLFKVIFLPAPARQGENYVPLYMTILKEAGSKQTVKWAWGPPWLYHRMLRAASWKSCNL